MTRAGAIIGLVGVALGLGGGLWALAPSPGDPHDPGAGLQAALDEQERHLAALASEQQRSVVSAEAVGREVRRQAAPAAPPGQPPVAVAAGHDPPPDPARQAAIAARVREGHAVIGAVVAGGGIWTDDLRRQFRDHLMNLPREEQAALFGALLAQYNAGKIEPPRGPVSQLFQLR